MARDLGKRSGLSANAREDEIRLKDVLSEFQNLEENEVKPFFTTFVNSQELQGCLIRFLSRQHPEGNAKPMHQDLDILRRVCSMLLSFYRGTVLQASKPKLASTGNDLAKNRPVIFQYLPHLMAIHLFAAQSPSEKRSYKFLEAFFLAIYNSEATFTKQCHQLQNTSGEAVRVPGLTQSSIFHESNRLDAETIEKLNKTIGNTVVILEPTFRQVRTVNASSRGLVLQLLWKIFNRHLPDISKSVIDQIANITLQLLVISNERRIFIPPEVLMEVLFLAYFCIYNGFQILGNQLLDQIEDRASANAWPSVLMVSTSIRRLSITCGPSQSSFVSPTPGHLVKHMITNASFRTKKISDDIPKVCGDDANDGMKIISEETPKEGQVQIQSSLKSAKALNGGDGAPVKAHTSNKEKLMAKLPNLKVSISIKKEKHASETPETLTTPEKLKSDKNPFSEKSKSDKKRSTKVPAALSHSNSAFIPSSPSSTNLPSADLNLSNSQNGDKVEELVLMKKLPQETISIQSLESGTTLF